MDTSTSTSTVTTTASHRRLVLLPLPFQGHLNPMLQLANILHSKGFSIIILHTLYNSPNPTNYPHFNFVPIPGTDDILNFSDMDKIIRVLLSINTKFMNPIKECLELLMSEDDGVACLITDAQWFGTQDVADILKLPRIVHRTSNISSFVCFAASLPLYVNGLFQRYSDEEMELDAPVQGLEPLKVKDLSKFFVDDSEGACKLLELLIQGTKRARALIWNTFKELEECELEALGQHFPNPHFLIGPFHRYFQASSSSLLAQDKTSLSWLNQHPPNSVLYVSFGSIVKLNESQFLEIAWGLANSKQPFLWVVRPRSVEGSEWLELLPDGFLERVAQGRGYIVKWAPQQDVLAHHAIGAFWTHCGWNSTLESICEGVPMICSPCFGDQLPNARYVSDVWKMGVVLENGFQREEIERAIKRVMVDEEGLKFKNEIQNMKWKIDLCLKKGGSSYSSLEDLVNYIVSF